MSEKIIIFGKNPGQLQNLADAEDLEIIAETMKSFDVITTRSHDDFADHIAPRRGLQSAEPVTPGWIALAVPKGG